MKTEQNPVKTVVAPVGSHDASVYWKRRAAVGGGFVLSLLLVGALVKGSGMAGSPRAATESPVAGLPVVTLSPGALPSSNSAGLDALNSLMTPSSAPSSSVNPPSGSPAAALSSTAASQPAASPSASSEPAASDSAAASTSPSASASASASASPSPSASVSCADSDLSITAALSSSQVAAGSGVGITLTLTNNGTTACLRDVGPTANEIKVVSGPARVWSSDDCSKASGSQLVTLDPGESWSTSIRWGGTLSSPGCSAPGAVATAGAYGAIARNASLNSDKAPFIISG